MANRPRKLTDAQVLAKLKKLLPLHALWCPKGKNRVRFLTLALAGEIGELANLIKKEWRGDKKARGPAWRRKVDDEIADIYIYTGILARVLGRNVHRDALRKTLEVEARPEFKAAIAKLKNGGKRGRHQ